MYSGSKQWNHCKTWKKVLVDNENRINALAAGMSDGEIEHFCEEYGCRVAYYDIEKETVIE